ncbi:MAG: SAM-dependent methyltransferase, partial [bacterium]
MEPKRRIEKKSSRTAAYTCMCRASSYLEKDSQFKSGDYIAVKLLPKFIKILLKSNILKLKGRISPQGIYPYVIARTKYIDHLFTKAIKNGFEQVLILGSGFDSRAIRLLRSNDLVNVYEIDTYNLMKAKLKQYKKRNISQPENNIFIPIDFNKEVLSTKLNENGFKGNKKTLFILEGLIMYLNKEEVKEIFKLIYDYSSSGSLVVFDYVYASVLRRENKYYGEKAIYRRVKKDKEQWIFGNEDGEIGDFLQDHKLSLVEHLDSIALEKKYFLNESGTIKTKINGTHCLVLA